MSGKDCSVMYLTLFLAVKFYVYVQVNKIIVAFSVLLSEAHVYSSMICFIDVH